MANEVKLIITADSSHLEQGLKKANTALISGTIKVEDAYKSLGIKSDQVYSMMRANALAAADFIKNKTMSSTEEITRAQKAAANTIAQINNEQFGKQTTLIDKLKSNWIAASAVIASAGIVAKQAWDMAKVGAEYREQSGILDNLAGKYSTTATSILSDMRRASDGLIADSDLMQISLAGISKGLKPDQLANLADAARILGDAVGVDATTALRDLTEALETGRTKGLKNYLGTALDLESVFGDLTSKMTTVEKTQAMYSITMIAAIDKQKQQIKEVDKTSDAIERLEAKWKNLKTTISASLADVVGVVLGSAEQDEQAKLARARLALMKSKDFDYVALSKMSVKDQNKYLDSIVAAENSWSESRFVSKKSAKNPYQAEIDRLTKILQAREDEKGAPAAAAKAQKAALALAKEIEDAQKKKLDADVKAFEFGMKMEDEWTKIKTDNFKEIEEAQKKKMDADVKAFELGMEYEDDAAKELKENAKDKADAYRTMYGDMKEDTGTYYIFQLATLNKEKKAYEDLKIDQNTIDKWYLDQKKKIDNNLTLSGNNFFKGIKVGYDNSLKDQMTWAKGGLAIFKSFASNSKSTLSNVLFDGIKGDLKSFDDYWQSFFDGLLRTFTDTVAEMATQKIADVVVSPLVSAISGAAGAAGSAAFDWLAGIDWFHDGAWYVGGQIGAANARRNLSNDEMMAILQKGEMVIPKGIADQIRSMMGGGSGGSSGPSGGIPTGSIAGIAAGSQIGKNMASAYGKTALASGLQAAMGILSGVPPSVAIRGAMTPAALIGPAMQGIMNAIAESFGVDTGFSAGTTGAWGGTIAGGILGGPLGALLGGLFGSLAGDVYGGWAHNKNAQAILSLNPGIAEALATAMSDAKDAISNAMAGGYGGGGGYSGEGMSGDSEAGPGGQAGSYRYGGISIGPDTGYPITVHGKEAHIPLPDGRSIPVELGGNDLLSEIRQLRAEMKAASYAIAKNTGAAARILDRWDGDGIPEERVI
jgi:hypothetical protein